MSELALLKEINDKLTTIIKILYELIIDKSKITTIEKESNISKIQYTPSVY